MTAISLPVYLERTLTLPERQEDARRKIAFSFILVYLTLLAANIVIPLLLLINHIVNLDQMKDLVLSVSAALGNIVGILGVVIGFYFKAAEIEDSERAQAKRAASGS